MLVENVDSVVAAFEQRNYILDRPLATALFLVLKLSKPLLLEGHAGLGKTETAKVLAALLGTRLIRLQCHEGLDVNSALYEWNYQKQLLAIQLQQTSNQTIQEKEKYIFGPDFLLERPLLAAISAAAPPVLLIDEIDRADEAFEAFLLELLSDFQISIPEMGTIAATHRPYVLLTSNRSRELSDALKRRCLYHWIDYPSVEKEVRIVRARFPEMNERFSTQIVRCVQTIRALPLAKPPGVAETLDWVQALGILSISALDHQTVENTIGCLAKSVEDAAKIRAQDLSSALL
jgi:MoxR-like ATPase